MTSSVDALIGVVRVSRASSFYAKHWGGATGFSELPLLTRSHLEDSALSGRRYKNEQSLVKIIRGGERPFLSEWSFEDLRQERFGYPHKRPLVYLQDPHDAVEKAVWCYQQGSLPLIGEKNPEITMHTAERFAVDSLIVDAESLQKVTPYLEGLSEPLESITIIGAAFDAAALMRYTRFGKRVVLIQALPETGAFGEAVLAEHPQFHPLEGCVVEGIGGNLVVTKLRTLITPIIRYDTGLRADVQQTV